MSWIVTTPRDALFVLGRFGVDEAERVCGEPDLGGVPQRAGIAARLDTYLATHDEPGADLLRRGIDACVRAMAFDADALVHELTLGVLGASDPEPPPRALWHCAAIVRAYLAKDVDFALPTLQQVQMALFALFAHLGRTGRDAPL